MANWTLLRALGFALKSRLYSFEMEDVDTFLTKVPNFAEGSDHSSSAPVKLGGSGLWLYGPFRSDDVATIYGRMNFDHTEGLGHANWRTGTVSTWETGAQCAWQAGTVLSITGTSNTTLQLSVFTSRWDFSGSKLNFNSGSLVNGNAGSTWAWAGTGLAATVLSFGAYTTLGLVGTSLGHAIINFGAFSELNMTAASAGSFALGVPIADSSSWTRSAGTHLFTGTSLLQFAGSSGITIGSGITIDASGANLIGTYNVGSSTWNVTGAAWTFGSGSTLSVNTDILRTKADIPTGTGAFRAHRAAVDIPTSGTMNVTVGDAFRIPNNNSGDLTVTLATPSEPTWAVFYSTDNFASSSSFLFNIRANGGVNPLVVFDGTTHQGAASVVLFWTGFNWIPFGTHPGDGSGAVQVNFLWE